jgi:hypothetical protein
MDRPIARTVEDPIGFSQTKRLAEEVRPKIILIIDAAAETIVLLESIGRRAASSGWEIARSSSEPSSCCSAFGTPRGPRLRGRRRLQDNFGSRGASLTLVSVAARHRCNSVRESLRRGARHEVEQLTQCEWLAHEKRVFIE